ncbi:SDR family oxidoreductase [Corynebacterium choanae]|uniref:3-oxoacyl-[acyl-carrier-protein] reductase FabG n=1 Tax=Corynebacterium choanae TaxID=1862358 RepID=A0A3G6J832_9CORY|nr:SDR family oxidoreductase [Corynebacterium choanae]AZA14146.1 3-oxoacyl-[acyl-carrier-protein] reductase FabG [Corynebacterium choanae]
MHTQARPLAIITGATSGIGAATVEQVTATHHVIAIGRQPAALDRLNNHPKVTPVALDLVDTFACTPGSTPTSLPATLAQLTHVDLLIHAAGIAPIATVADTDATTWSATLALNVTVPARLTALLTPALRRAKGQVIFINSGAGRYPAKSMAAYVASKHALVGLANTLRLEEQPHGVRVTTVYPGPVDTPMQQQMQAQQHPNTPYNADHYSTPEEIAAAIVATTQAGPHSQIEELVIRPHIPGG